MSRELNATEIAQVSGAGLFTDLGGAIAGAIGSIVDAGTSLGGLKTDATTAATNLGKGIGSLLELNFLNAVSQIGSGIIGIVGFGIDAISQITGKKS
ncbi:hypothetical protein BBB56_09670 [Candidatus Pantoea deserta]|uniref:Uncharacterized protein n=1 Tax=Candidatus Pantoea deserta TaxID=1869313 RepID=A0A3N4PCU5_9GAMM|nr:hypothetical protein [Pantoea deserta]RPE01540.1 hypothetical protein BBB56_09670 [Pantoea deserta]